MNTLEKLIKQCSSEIDEYIVKTMRLDRMIREHELIINLLSDKALNNKDLEMLLNRYRQELSQYKTESEWVKMELENSKYILENLVKLKRR